jgi:hypothetical protein
MSSKTRLFQNNTWIELESVLIVQEMTKKADLSGIIQRNSETYQSLRDNIVHRLLDVGNPLYVRQFVILPGLETGFRTSHIAFGCRPGTCAHVNSHNLHVFTTRIDLYNDELKSETEAFNEFVDNNSGVFTQAIS